MTTLNIHLQFHEPYRMGPWQEKGNRSPYKKKNMRVQGFARCHKESNGKIRPYITGTLFRSALLRAVEQELVLSEGIWKEHKCCPGLFFSNDSKNRPKHLRRRSTLRWTDVEMEECKKDNRDQACPLCLLLGRFDRAGRDSKENASYDVRFCNLSIAGDDLWDRPEDIGVLRTLNRVDAHTGKAHDFFQVYEIDTVRDFYGTVLLADNLPKKEEVTALITHCLGFISTLCGALCSISIDNGNDNAPLQTDRQSSEIDIALPALVTRSMADAVLALRQKDPPTISLPKGAVNLRGDLIGHHVWDTRVNNSTLRRELEPLAKSPEVKNDPLLFRRTIEKYGQQIFLQYKGEDQESYKISSHAIRTDTISVSESATHSDRVKSGDIGNKEWIITGMLVAATPFSIGTDPEKKDHISRRTLLTGERYYRLPRSVQRGVLRDTLKYAGSNREGCSAEIGRGRECPCPICQVMRNVTLIDTKSIYRPAPDIRHRIRRDARHGTTLDGHLYDVEYGLQGSRFPFVLRHRGNDRLPQTLKTILTWWKKGNLFLGGHTGIGKGRFVLDDLKVFSWDLSTLYFRKEYAELCGLREWCAEIEEDPQIGLTQDSNPINSSKEFPWNECCWGLEFQGPVLTADTIAALVQDEADAVYFRKSVIDDNGDVRHVPVLRGEGLRGLVRTAVARATGKDLLNEDHEDCLCELCRLFGNEHQAGVIRFEDLELQGKTREKRLDHLAIDRIDHSVKEKYDDRPLIGSPDAPLVFQGSLWLHRDMNPDDLDFLRNGFLDIISNMYPVGGRSAIGYGRITTVSLPVELEISTRKSEASSVESTFLKATDTKAKPETVEFNPREKATYNPYYFIAPGKDVPVRTTHPISHATLQTDKLTGKIVCTLKTISPLLIPDTEESGRTEGTEQQSQEFNAFRLGETIMIPGSQIRGAVSQVFETLTNSCFRVTNQKRILSWRMDANDHQNYQPGQIMKGAKQVKPAHAFRLPLYDQNHAEHSDEYKNILADLYTNALNENINRIENSPWKEFKEKEKKKKLDKCKDILDRPLSRTEMEKILASGLNGLIDATIREQLLEKFHQDEENCMQKAEQTNKTIADAALHNQKVLGKLNETDREQILRGKKRIEFHTEQLGAGHDANFQIIKLGAENTKNTQTRWGYLKITGPNNVNEANVDGDTEDNLYKKYWNDPLDFSFRLSGPPQNRPNTQGTRKYPRPGFACVVDGKQYTLHKRCERIFEVPKQSKLVQIPRKIREGYKEILVDYCKNAMKNPVGFNSRLGEQLELQEGDLVYYRKDNNSGKVDALAPVCISRLADDRSLGKRLPKGFAPCAYVCLEECDTCTASNCPIPLYREGYPVNGLCPTCHLFGSQMHKGRVRFGFASPSEKAIDTYEVTLPLQERPRLTWVLDKEVRGTDTEVPGRKFYLRHKGWETIADKKTDPTTKKEIEKKKNNVTIEAIKPEQQFQFTVEFENLTKKELGLLLYSLGLEDNMAHALGRGKPFGFGQCQIKIDRIEQRMRPQEWKQIIVDCLPMDMEIVQKELASLPPEGATWHELDHIRDLRFMLTRHEEIVACYPSLDVYQTLKEDKQYTPRRDLKVQLQTFKQSVQPTVLPFQ